MLSQACTPADEHKDNGVNKMTIPPSPENFSPKGKLPLVGMMAMIQRIVPTQLMGEELNTLIGFFVQSILADRYNQMVVSGIIRMPVKRRMYK